MEKLIDLFKLICALVGAILLGRWYLEEARKAYASGQPWYKAHFLTVPGMLILLLIFLLPLMARLLK